MKHTFQLRTSLETSDQPLPEVALSRLRSTFPNIRLDEDIESHAIPERAEIGQPEHHRIVAELTFTPQTKFKVPTNILTESQARERLGWSTGTYTDLGAPTPDGCVIWKECEQDPPEKQLSERTLPDKITFDYYDDSEVIEDYGISVEDYYNEQNLLDTTVEEMKEIAKENILYDVPWFVIYHKNEVNDWSEIVRKGEVPDTL